MRILVGWEDRKQADLIGMYLSVAENDVVIADSLAEFAEAARADGPWDAALLSLSLGPTDALFSEFNRFRDRFPVAPIIGACDPQEVFSVVRFMARGMAAYVIRDASGDFMFMLPQLVESTVEAARAELDRQLAQRLREEVDSVRKLQESVIPREINAPEGYEIVARYEPSQIRVVGGRPVTLAGGDYYDVFRLDDEHLVLLVGDASGHGMKAAMSIMTMHTLVRMIRNQRYRNTADFVAQINNQLCEQTIVAEEGGFITMLYAILNCRTHELQWTSAGHPTPLIQDLNTGEVQLMGPRISGGLPLAIMPDVEYETETTRIPPNARILLYTDGLEEAFPEGDSQRHDQFGVEGLMRTMKESRDQPLEKAMQALFDATQEFTRGAGRHDDTSVVMLERKR
ncbi:MAG: serine/threonine-protein phosphatase [Planctomycetota bacterium]|nr:MAG: serine/threonine-protein phosphatase [Planctomycetota bacterium]